MDRISVLKQIKNKISKGLFMLTIKLPKAYLSAKGWVMDTCIHKIAKGRFVAYAIGHKIDNENKPLMYIKWLS